MELETLVIRLILDNMKQRDLFVSAVVSSIPDRWNELDVTMIKIIAQCRD